MHPSPGPGALPRPQNNMGSPHPMGSTWRVSTEGASRGTVGVTAEAWGALDRVLCVVPPGRGDDTTQGAALGVPRLQQKTQVVPPQRRRLQEPP